MFEVAGERVLYTHILFPSLTKERRKLAGAALGVLIYGRDVISASLAQSHWGSLQYSMESC